MVRPSSHRLLLTVVGLLIFGQIVAFWPSSTPRETAAPVAGSLPGEEQTSPFSGFEAPDGAAPDYTIGSFRYVSVARGAKQWELHATEARFYSPRDLVLATEIQASLFSDAPGRDHAVRVSGRESRYSVSTRVLEVGGSVVARFPDGSELRSEYLRFDPVARTVLIPGEYAVSGTGPASGRTRIEFRSRGLHGELARGSFSLQRDVELRAFSRAKPGAAPAIFHAARAVIERNEGVARLLSEKTETAEGFVTLRHEGDTTLVARSRTMEVRTDAGTPGKNSSFTAIGDVRIEEWKRGTAQQGSPFRHSTSGRAEFHPEESEFVLTEYPQAYQGEDTMTGDVIRVDRKNDRVEVENTNAISRGSYE